MNIVDSDDFYSAILNSLVYFIRNIKPDACIEDIEKLLYYKQVDNKEEYKKYILKHFNWTNEEFDRINKYELAKIFEYLSALELSNNYNKFILPYDLLSIDFKDSIAMPSIDIGLDLISLDTTYAGQCKNYIKNSFISSNSIQRSDYCCLRINRKIGNMLDLEFITPAEVKFSKAFRDFIPKHKILTFDNLRKWLYHLPLKNNIINSDNNNVNNDNINVNNNNGDNKIIGFKEDINVWNENKCDNFVWRDCQKGAINHIFNRIFNNDIKQYKDDNIYVNMVCGVGKSDTIIGFIKYYLKNYKILILVPRLLLLEQFTKVLDYWELDYNCVGTGYNEIINKNICLCVYNSIDKVKDLDWHYMIIDEAHHIEKRLLIKKLNIVNDDDDNDDSESGDDDNDSDDDNSDDSDNEDSDNDDNDHNDDSDSDNNSNDDNNDEDDNSVFSDVDDNKYLDTIANLTKTTKSIFFSASLKRCDYNYDLRSAINDDVLVDYQLHIPIYYNGTFEENVVKYIIQNPIYSSMIAFCNTINDCVKYKDLLLQSGINCDYITSNQSKKERNIIMDNFKSGKIRVLLSVRILCEGINIPSCNSVMFIDERYSEIEVLQCMLRCTRKYKNKKLAHIILPPTYKDEINSKMIKVIMKIAKGDSKLYNILKEKKESNKIKVNIIDKNNDDIDKDDEDYEEKDIYDIIYDSSMKIINGSDNIERIKEEILLFKKFHMENGRFIKRNEKSIINGYEISGMRLNNIKHRILKKLDENDDLIIFIKNNYIRLYDWYISNKTKERKETIYITLKEKLLLYKQFHDENGRFIKKNEKAIINDYEISGSRLHNIKRNLKNLEENDEIMIFIKNNFIDLYDNIIILKTKEKKEKKETTLKDEILLYKQFHNENGRFIKKNEKAIINGYEISGSRLTTIKQLYLKKLEENDELMIFTKDNYIELYDNIIILKTTVKKEKKDITLKEELLLYKQFYDENDRFIKRNEKAIINGYNINGQRLTTIKQKLKNLDENDEIMIFTKNNYIELYDNIIILKTTEKKEKIDITLKEEILLYKQFHDENGRFIKQKEKAIVNEYEISGIRLNNIKKKLKNLEENNEIMIFTKNNYIELYDWYITNKNKEKKEKIDITLKEEILLYKQFHDDNGRCIKKNEKAIINGYEINGNRLGKIKERYLKKLEENDELIIFTKNNYIELYEWYKQYKK